MKKKPHPWHLIMAGVIAVAVSSVAVAALVLSEHEPSSSSAQPYPWDFPGAYANYWGSGTILGVPVSLNHTLGILHANSTKAEFLVTTVETFGSGPPRVDRATAWMPATRSDDPPFLATEGGVSVLHYDANITLGETVVPVTIYSIKAPIEGGLDITSIVSKGLHFPLEYVFSIGNQPPITLQLVRTNIPGLLA